MNADKHQWTQVAGCGLLDVGRSRFKVQRSRFNVCRKERKERKGWRGSVCNRALSERASIFGVRREAQRHAAFGFCGQGMHAVSLLQPWECDPKRRRRYALPAQSKASHDVGCGLLDVGCWMFDVRCSWFKVQRSTLHAPRLHALRVLCVAIFLPILSLMSAIK